MPTTGVRVVQTLGGIGRPDAEEYAADLVRRMAAALRAATVLLPAPGIVASPAVREALESDPHVREALDQLGHIDMLLVGIGSLASNPVLNDERSITPGALDELRRGGAVGDIALRFFDADGHAVASSLDDRLLGISLEQLRATPRVVAIAGGIEKVEAIRAALRTGVIDDLVIDLETAERLLDGASTR
jgi:DNA-binding transcriptional regulator LsrR (DeoR family)